MKCPICGETRVKTISTEWEGSKTTKNIVCFLCGSKIHMETEEILRRCREKDEE